MATAMATWRRRDAPLTMIATNVMPLRRETIAATEPNDRDDNDPNEMALGHRAMTAAACIVGSRMEPCRIMPPVSRPRTHGGGF